MAEILKEWLTERLQIPIKWEADDFGNIMKNGHVIANILLSYRIINDEQFFLIHNSNSLLDIKNNWKYLVTWLRELNIILTDIDLNNIREGRGSTLLRLFYSLFLYLDKKDRIDFIKHERKMVSNLIDKVSAMKRFIVKKVDDEIEKEVDDLARPLLNERHVIEWQKNKAKEMKDLHDFVNQKYEKMIKKIDESKCKPQHIPLQKRPPSATAKIEMAEFAKKYPYNFINYPYEKLLELEKKQECTKPIIDTEWAKNYMDNLNEKLNIRSESEEFQKHLSAVVSATMWEMSVAEEESLIDTELGKKILKLSQYEKQMCTQIMEVKQQARNIAENRRIAEVEFADQRDRQFNQYLDNLKEQLHLELVEIDFEKSRQNTLHKILYAEKMKRKRQHYHEICYETMLSILDYATKYGYYKKLYEEDVPEYFVHEWKNLYFKSQPIFDILDPLEDLLKDQQAEEETVPEEEEIIRLELERQDVLNECEFDEYINYLGPWTLENLIPNFDNESEERKYEYLGLRVLGHVVFSLLEIKYPFPPARPPADIPFYPSRALVRGLPDRTITLALQVLLQNKQIFVIRIESAVNHCLKMFKTEMIGCIDIELSYEKFILAASEETDKELIKSMKTEEDILSKSSEAYTFLGPIPPNTKQTQTPKTIPEEEIKLSDAAELGRYAYEALSFGDTLTDHLIAAMLVEYIKAQDNIGGFVIINYPNSYREAQILEETFSGREPPDEKELLEDRDDIYLEETIAKHRKKEKDPFKEIRVSKILTNPHKNLSDQPFESYFTTYINLKESEDILQEIVIWDLADENSELVDRFYAILGLNYSMYYETIEKEFLALLCRYIIGDLQLPWSLYETLFGENVLSQLDFLSTEDKRQKFKVVKAEVSGNLKTKEKRLSKVQTKSLLKQESSHIKNSDSNHTGVEGTSSITVSPEENECGEMEVLEDIKILAGEEFWEYGSLPIVENVGKALASCWEQIEKSYVNDIEQLLLAKRLQLNCVIPYTRFLKDKMEQIITLPSYKQDLVAAFQKEYNEFENDWRQINISKNEWHCRIKDLKQRLHHICDERKLHAEQQRQSLICENWTMEELTTLVNTYISLMQTEINRSTLTYQIMHDFYFSQLKHYPTHDRLPSKELTKLSRETDEGSGKKSTEDKMFRQIRNAFMDLQLKNMNIDFANNPFNMIINNNLSNALKITREMNDQFRSLIAREYADVAKIVVPSKKKDDVEKTSNDDSIPPEEIYKQNCLKCIEEWSMGVNGEMFRVNLRLQALQSKCYIDMKLFNDVIFKAFTDIKDRINEYYLNEITSVNRLCKYIQLAIEEGRVIPESVVLEYDQFIIDPNLLQIPTEQAEFDTGELKEIVSQLDFKISQLVRLRSQFKICAPTGLALQQTFVYLLQDFIFYGKETQEGPLVPEAWRLIDPEQVPKLVVRLFGETVYVDWRDFLIICLNIRYPTVHELLELRRNFRCKDSNSTELLDRDNFLAQELWFEGMFDPEDPYATLRKVLIKHFLFELFETAPNLMNYSAFLLAFCKSDDPITGFTTALSMAVGKEICYKLEQCLDVVCKLIEDKRYRDACRQCALQCSDKFITELINRVVSYCEGTSIEEIAHTTEDKKAGKGKKGKNSGKEKAKGKSLKPSQSAKSKSSFSMEVKQTYICPPCAENTEDEKPSEPEVVEEQEVVMPPMPNELYEYAVSQNVIWNILKICMPWHFLYVPEIKETPYVNNVEEVLKRLETDTDNGDIYICKFVTDPIICKLLNKVQRFKIVDLAEEVQKILVH